MKIHPPKIAIDPADPYKEALYSRKEFGESLTQLLRNINESLVIFINAPWGEGKSTFAKMWRASLSNQKLDVIYFDAYAADYFDDPFVSFTGEILEMVDRRLKKAGADERREFKKTAIEVGKKMGGLVAKVGLRALTLGAVEAAHLTELQEIGSDLASGVADIGAELMEKKIEGYASEKKALDSFKKSLSKLAKLVRDTQGFPLTIIVDELDRCRPDFALGLLERMKHLFDVEDMVFILLVNRDQIEAYIRTVYGAEVNASSYLLKFGNLFVDLPNQQPAFGSGKDRSNFCRDLFQHYDFESIPSRGSLSQCLILLVDLLNPTLREMERAFGVMSLYYSSLPQNPFTHEFLIPMLSLLKVKQPATYRLLNEGNITAAGLSDAINISRIPTQNHYGVSLEWIKETIGFLLLSDVELKKIIDEEKKSNAGYSSIAQLGGWLTPYGFERKKVIPYFCSQLERFTFQP